MLFLRYLELCFWLFLAIFFNRFPPRRPRGSLRNYARSVCIGHFLNKAGKAGTFKGKFARQHALSSTH